MVNHCYDCQYVGGEIRKTDGTVEYCKRQCLADPSCVGIDAGNFNNRCYFVNSTNVGNYSSFNYQAWKKSTKCGDHTGPTTKPTLNPSPTTSPTSAPSSPPTSKHCCNNFFLHTKYLSNGKLDWIFLLRIASFAQNFCFQTKN